MSSSTDSTPPLLSPAAEAFSTFLERVDRGEAPDFEELCRDHPGEESKLRAMHTQWLALGGALDELGDDLGTRPTSDSDSRGRASTADSSADVVEQLRRESTDSKRFTVRREIARGGMGAVLKVWDRDLRRNLAMKVLLSKSATRFEPRALSRFLEEAQITGQLDHPGIVPVHELGIDAQGRVYFTMPLVRGSSFQEIVDRVHGDGSWTMSRALEVVVRVCEAVGYAHARGVVHRDLKPANVMVGAFGETYVMDWGLARVLTEEERSGPATSSTELHTVRSESPADSPLVTMDGDVVGTPIYMSPEQAHGWQDRVGPKSDVYSIGAILYHLLGGRRPYFDSEADSASSVLMAVQSRPPQPVHALAPTLPAELTAICEKAMARDAQRRYASAMELADDLRAYLDGRVVGAHRTGAWAELKKWTQRNRTLTVSSSLAVAFLVVGFASTVTLWLRAKENEGLAGARAAEAIDARTRADETAATLADQLRTSSIERGRLLASTGGMQDAEDLLWREFLADRRDLHAAWALRELYAREPGVAAWEAHSDEVGAVRWLPEGDLVSVDTAGRMRLWEGGRSTLSGEVQAHEGAVYRFVLAPEGRMGATAGHSDGGLALWQLPEQRPIARVTAHEAGTYAAAFHPTHPRIATTGLDGLVREWTLPDLTLLREHDASDEGQAYGLCYAPDGSALAFSTSAGSVHYWPQEQPAPTKSWRSACSTVIFADEGRRLVTGGRERHIRSWLLSDDRPGTPFSGDNGSIRDLVMLSEDGPLVSAGWYRLDFWDHATWERLYSYSLPQDANRVDLSPDGRLLAVAGGHGRIIVYEPQPHSGTYVLPGHSAHSTVAFHPDARSVLTGDGSGVVRMFDATSGKPLGSFQAHDAGVVCLDLSADGSVLASAAADGSVNVRHLASGSVLAEFTGIDPETKRPIDLSPDGTLLAQVLPESRVQVVDVVTGAERALVVHRGRFDQALSVALLQDAGLFATSARRAGVRIWTMDGHLAQEAPRESTTWTLAARPDGLIAGASWSHDVELFDARDGSTVRALRGHAGTVWGTAFHPTDERLIASCADDRTVRLWDIETGRNLVSFDVTEHFGGTGATSVAFSPDGLTLAAAGRGDPVLWDLSYYDRHVAGNLAHHVERLAGELETDLDERAAEAWAKAVLDRPWPRLSLEPAR